MMNIHIEGGIVYMVPLSLLFLINLGLIIFGLLSTISKKQVKKFWLEMIKQIGWLALVWGVLSTMIGLHQAFRDLSTMTETLPLNIIMGGLKVALITAEYGLIIFVVSLFAYIVLKLVNKQLLTAD